MPKLLLGSCIVLVAYSIAVAQSSSRTDIMSKLRSHDQLYQAAITARGVLVAPRPFNAPYLPSEKMEWVYTQDSDQCAIIQKFLGVNSAFHIPKHSPKGPTPPGISYDSDGTPHLSLKSVVSFYRDGEQATSTEIDSSFLVNGKGDLLPEDGKNSRSTMKTKPDSDILSLQPNRILWTLGRGYARYLDSVSSTEALDNGLVKIVATGSLNNQAVGKWTLEVDPQRQFIVRSAVFSTGTGTFVRVKNSEITTDGKCVYPKKGECEISGLRTELEVISMTFSLDKNTLREARQIALDESQPRSYVADYRVTPPQISYRDTPAKSVAVPQRSRTSGLRILLISLNIAILLVLIAYGYYGRKWFRRTK